MRFRVYIEHSLFSDFDLRAPHRGLQGNKLTVYIRRTDDVAIDDRKIANAAPYQRLRRIRPYPAKTEYNDRATPQLFDRVAAKQHFRAGELVHQAFLILFWQSKKELESKLARQTFKTFIVGSCCFTSYFKFR
jgi:hypothetical protein